MQGIIAFKDPAKFQKKKEEREREGDNKARHMLGCRTDISMPPVWTQKTKHTVV